MPTLANVVMNGSDAKMVEKVGVATIVVNKSTWPVAALSNRLETAEALVPDKEKSGKKRKRGDSR